jgi:hypothetical protein
MKRQESIFMIVGITVATLGVISVLASGTNLALAQISPLPTPTPPPNQPPIVTIDQPMVAVD